jgi:hypothetical protein
MTTSLPLPNTVGTADPAAPFQTRNWVFDHVPSLGELLPKHKGRPGFEYLQCTVGNLRRAQDEGWTEVVNTMVYVIEGPKGEVNLKLLARGRPIPGQPMDSGARLCLCDLTVQDLTGVWINPNKHIEPELEIIEAVSEGDTPSSVPTKLKSEEKDAPKSK